MTTISFVSLPVLVSAAFTGGMLLLAVWQRQQRNSVVMKIEHLVARGLLLPVRALAWFREIWRRAFSCWFRPPVVSCSLAGGVISIVVLASTVESLTRGRKIRTWGTVKQLGLIGWGTCIGSCRRVLIIREFLVTVRRKVVCFLVSAKQAQADSN